MTWADVPRTVRTGCGVTLILLLACATRGDRFNVDAVPKIIPGVTSQMEVQRWFGKPNSVRVWGSGGAKWRYVYEEEQHRDTRTITKIGRSLASIFGHRTYIPPVDVAYSKTTRDSLEVQFDAEGTVIDYSYERQAFPTRRVY
jgi:outer membrane protein assembly factor BamE (lipoprotein component of BamABCDE complex)